MNLPKKTNAFTLLELMLVIGLIGIISAATIPSFSNYIQNQNLKRARDQLYNDMRTVQNKALTGALADQVVDSVQVKYWVLLFTEDSSEYRVFITDDNATCTIAESNILKFSLS